MTAAKYGRCARGVACPAFAVLAVLLVTGRARAQEIVVPHAPVSTQAQGVSAMGSAVRVRPEDIEANAMATGREGMRKTIEGLLIPKLAAAKQTMSGDVAATDPVLRKLFEAYEQMMDEKYAEAIPALEASLRVRTDDAAVWVSLGWAYWSVNRRDDAIKLWKTIQKIDPQNSQAYALLGTAYFGLKDVGQAEWNLRRSLELKPEQFEIQMMLGVLYRWYARNADSVRVLRPLHVKFPDRLDVTDEFALSLYNNADFEEAAPLLKISAAAHPKDSRYATALVRSLLRIGQVEEARKLAGDALKADASSTELLLLDSEIALKSGDRDKAEDRLDKVVRETKDEELRDEAARSLLRLQMARHQEDAYAHPVSRSIRVAELMVDKNTNSVDWRILLGELYLMNKEYKPAKDIFGRVLEKQNSNNGRGLAGLFEIGQATRAPIDSARALDRIRQFNPQDPYWFERCCRFELSRNNISGAFDAARQLEQAGNGGAAAVLLYRDLSAYELIDRVSLRQFRSHVLALKKAGYHFVRMEDLVGAVSHEGAPPANRWAGSGSSARERMVLIAFDGPGNDTLRMADAVAEELNVPMTAFLAPPFASANVVAGAVDWNQFMGIYTQGHWSVGAMLSQAMYPLPVDATGRTGMPLANRLWREGGGLESLQDYTVRLDTLYSESKKAIESRIGKGKCVAVRYPRGDIGQMDVSNVTNAPEINLEAAGRSFQMGFINSEFGYAVHGNNPLLFQAYMPNDHDSPEQLLSLLVERHPIDIARRLRVQLCTLDGRVHEARMLLDILQRDGFPSNAFARLDKFVTDRTILRGGTTSPIEPNETKDSSDYLDNPYIAGAMQYYQDSEKRRNLRGEISAGLDPVPGWHLEVFGGRGRLRQGAPSALDQGSQVTNTHAIAVDETTLGLRANYKFFSDSPRVRPIAANGWIAQRSYSGDADSSGLAYGVSAGTRILPPVDVQAGYEHDFMYSALSVKNDTTYNRKWAGGVWMVTDVVRVRGTYSDFDISDGNSRVHYDISPMVKVLDDHGVWLGLAYAHVNADRRSAEYWSPYNERQITAVAEWVDRTRWLSYEFTAQAGVGSEAVRPEDTAAYERLREQAIKQNWLDQLGAAPESSWTPIYGLSGLLQADLSRNFSGYAQSAYIRTPNHNEFYFSTGLKLTFY
jgi:Flp pilus assembly protein TadD